MKNLVLVLAACSAVLATGPASAQGQAPEIYAVQSSLVGYRRLPSPAPTPIIINCWYRLGSCTFNAISFKIRDPDTPELTAQLMVKNSSNEVVYMGEPSGGWFSGDEAFLSKMWMPQSTVPPGMYRLYVQVSDPEGNTSAWAESDPIMFI